MLDHRAPTTRGLLPVGRAVVVAGFFGRSGSWSRGSWSTLSVSTSPALTTGDALSDETATPG
jgi:hypothetical protein